MKRVVGTDSLQYPQIRNFAGLPLRHYSFRRVRDINKVLNGISFRLTGSVSERLLNTYRGSGSGCDLMHFFNTVSPLSKPWITTFETFLPRWGKAGDSQLKKGIRWMASPSCKKLLALSECTASIQAQWMDSNFPEWKDEIMAKVQVMYPAQKASIHSLEEKHTDAEVLTCVIVGTDFFRKGGLETLHAFDNLLSRKLPLRLHVVSSLATGDYATHSDEKWKREALKIMNRHPENIIHHHSLPQDEVISLFRNADIGLLPTWADTFGYSVLEAQSAGCPVISTDVRALREINSDSTGWLIPVGRDDWGNAVIGTEGQRRSFSRSLQEQLEAILLHILEHPHEVAAKGKASLERIRQLHDPVKRAEELEALYDFALK